MAELTLPLTTLAFGESGNRAVKEQHDTMLSYYPYDNVAAKPYPASFFTAALHDSQVKYHEPAKWVAKLRATKAEDHELLFVHLENRTCRHCRPGWLNARASLIIGWIIGQNELR